MSGLRKGDTIIAANMTDVFVVETHDYINATAVKQERPHRRRTFRLDRLECVDPDEGLWQEMTP